MNTTEKEKLFLEITGRYRASIWRVCNAYLYDRTLSEDLFQDILIEIWNGMEKFRGEAGWHTWIYRVAVNTALRFNKKEKRSTGSGISIPDVPDEEQSKEKIKLENQLSQLHSCIAALGEQDRLVITLLLEELSYTEIAEVCGISVNNTGVRISRIKEKLLNCMNTNGHGKS